MKNQNYKQLLKAIGPGIIFAGAAIGGSHLIQSTRAGADFGFKLLIIVILANLFKYPFFEYGIRYTSATGKHLLEGYRSLGKWAVWTFFILSIITGIVNAAALSVVCAGLLSYIFGTGLTTVAYSIILLIICLLILVIGKYPLLDSVMKTMVIVLTITTVIAFFLAFNKGMDVIPGFVGPDIISTSSIFFLIALMGWMPAPIEVSVWTSLWALGRSEQVSYKPTLRESLIDFHIGYIGTAILAVLFLSLGAFIMYGSGLPFSPNGTKFSTQLIHLYTTLFGQWSAYVIAPAAFLTIFSSLLSVMDGYPRTYDASIQTLKLSIAKPKLNMFFVFIVALVITAIIIIIFFTKSMTMMIDMATIISFLAAPIFAFLNFKIVTQKDFPDGFKPPQWLRVLSYFGIIFLSVFSLIYLFTLFFVSL